jgi:hypothetical protein
MLWNYFVTIINFWHRDCLIYDKDLKNLGGDRFLDNLKKSFVTIAKWRKK